MRLLAVQGIIDNSAYKSEFYKIWAAAPAEGLLNMSGNRYLLGSPEFFLGSPEFFLAAPDFFLASPGFFLGAPSSSFALLSSSWALPGLKSSSFSSEGYVDKGLFGRVHR